MASKKSRKSAPLGTGSPADSLDVSSAEPIIAVGASGAHCQSVERFPQDLAPDNTIAVVLVFQHREALDDGHFKQSLAEHGRDLTGAADGTPVESGRIYWSEPNTPPRCPALWPASAAR